MDQHLGFEHIFSVYTTFPDIDGHPIKRLAGRFVIHNNQVEVLQDYFNLLDGLDGPIDEYKLSKLKSLERGMHTMVVSDQDHLDGKHPDLVKDPVDNLSISPEETEETPVSEFMYTPHGGEPFSVQIRHNTVILNGKPLKDSEAKHLLSALEEGVATCEHAAPELKKSSEEILDDLQKADPGLNDALEALRSAVKAGHIPREHMRAISNALFKDTMVPSLGNRKAYNDYLKSKKAQGGVHIALDSNNFKHVNDTFGHEVGDTAIKNYGNAIRGALDETVGKRKGFAARQGGDEFHIHLPTHEHAEQFSRSLKQKLDALPALGGTHKYSMSLGLGSSPEAADKAMYHAKAAKVASGSAPGQANTHVHSLVPGKEGPINVGTESTTGFHIPSSKLQTHTESSSAQAEQKVWHGTPFEFNKFDPSKTGSAEGAALYGRGHYFAADKDTAQHYATELSKNRITIAGKNEAQFMAPEQREALRLIRDGLDGGLSPGAAVGRAQSHLERNIKAAESRLGGLGGEQREQLAEVLAMRKAAWEWLDGLDTKEIKASDATGRVLGVSIPDDSRLLGWDVPIEKHSADIQAKLAALGISDTKMSGGKAYNSLAERLGSQDAASSALADAGIPGARYIGDRSSVSPEYNIWDTKKIRIGEPTARPVDSTKGF